MSKGQAGIQFFTSPVLRLQVHRPAELTLCGCWNSEHVVIITMVIWIPYSKAGAQFHKCFTASNGCHGLGEWCWGYTEKIHPANTLFVILGVTAVLDGTQSAQIRKTFASLTIQPWFTALNIYSLISKSTACQFISLSEHLPVTQSAFQRSCMSVALNVCLMPSQHVSVPACQPVWISASVSHSQHFSIPACQSLWMSAQYPVSMLVCLHVSLSECLTVIQSACQHVCMSACVSVSL